MDRATVTQVKDDDLVTSWSFECHFQSNFKRRGEEGLFSDQNFIK